MPSIDVIDYSPKNSAMHVENNPDFKTVWQLAHNWIGADSNKTNINDISPELRIAIHRLMHAMYCREITTRWKGYRIFLDNSFFSIIFDFYHDLKFIQCLRKSKFDKTYLNKLYVKRNEVIKWCNEVILLDPPQCWTSEHLSNQQTAKKVTKNFRPIEEAEDRIRCQAIATALWELDPAIHPNHMAKSRILQQIGNGGLYGVDTIINWIVEFDPQKNVRKPGRPPKIQYKINLKMEPQSKK